jgi:hypothetical protein
MGKVYDMRLGAGDAWSSTMAVRPQGFDARDEWHYVTREVTPRWVCWRGLHVTPGGDNAKGL